MKIFVQIASYRDPQLVPTIENMLENAKKPKNLVIGMVIMVVQKILMIDLNMKQIIIMIKL